jgi:hypothetical protein
MRNPTMEEIFNLWRTKTTKAERPKRMTNVFRISSPIDSLKRFYYNPNQIIFLTICGDLRTLPLREKGRIAVAMRRNIVI